MASHEGTRLPPVSALVRSSLLKNFAAFFPPLLSFLRASFLPLCTPYFRTNVVVIDDVMVVVVVVVAVFAAVAVVIVVVVVVPR